MTKYERQIMLFLANAFSDLSIDMIKYVEGCQVNNPNEEQLEAHIQYMLEHRNRMVDGFKMIKPDITKAQKECKQLCKLYKQKQKQKK